jgi:hypothetical protein
MTASKPDLLLSFANSLDDRVFGEIGDDLRAGGAQVVVTRRPPEGPYAFLEWLIPTAVILWMVKPYVQEFSKETGKLHAGALHNGLCKLWSKVFGPKPEITYSIVGTSGKVGSQVFSAAVSVKMTRNDGGDVILLFPSRTSDEDFSLAVERFIELMKKHYARSETDPLTQTMGLISYLNHRNFQALVYMNPDTQTLELIDYVGSSQARKVTTHRIPE